MVELKEVSSYDLTNSLKFIAVCFDLKLQIIKFQAFIIIGLAINSLQN